MFKVGRIIDPPLASRILKNNRLMVGIGCMTSYAFTDCNSLSVTADGLSDQR